MRSITSAVRALIEKDPVAYEALGRGMLNTNAFARFIHRDVETWCKKDVKLNTIVTALLRLRDEIAGTETLVPKFCMGSMTVKIGLVEMSLIKGNISHQVATWLAKQKRDANDFYLMIDGNREADFIFPERIFASLEKKMDLSGSLNGIIKGLAAITLSYSSDLTFVPNVGYALMRSLALKKINVVEVISSYSEVAFLIDTNDVDRAIESLKGFL